MASLNDQMVLHEELNEAISGFTHALMATPEWSEMLEAQRAFEADDAMATLIARYNVLARRHQRQEPATRLTDAEQQELATIGEQIQRSPLFHRREASMIALQGLLQTVNQELSTRLGLDFAAIAAPRRGGCCG